jgi:toxin-antitoxin system PIN domain toxin
MSDLPDLNVWLALADPDHEYHERARRYWETEAASRLSFCRVTMLGLLRLLTNRKVMRNDPFTPDQAWLAYRSFLALPEVVFLAESPSAESQMATWTDSPLFAPGRWTDAWLAALALTTRCRLVSFDSDFRNFPGISFFHLKK